MWDSGDKENYEQHTANSLGQICNDTFSQDLQSAGINNAKMAIRHFNLHGKNEGRTDKIII